MSELFYDVLETPIGFLHVSGTSEAICGISFYTPAESVKHTNPILRDCIEQLRSYFDGSLQHFSLPTAPSGTPFEVGVWQELTRIPFGVTNSYLDVARRLNKPAATRAVGRANGLNPISIVIPCHRVIGSNGSLTGYAGELWRKRWLLDHEAKLSGTLLI